MDEDKAYPTTDEIYELLKRTSLPTVLVEGKNDIIFYRRIEEDLKEFGVDMLPAGNKGAVLELYNRFSTEVSQRPIIYVVDNDLWIHGYMGIDEKPEGVITTKGYSIENDLYTDGELENLFSQDERERFHRDLERFLYWYALAVNRKISNLDSTFRTHPSKILNNEELYEEETKLKQNEDYPTKILEELREKYFLMLRGKSLFALIVRELSSKKRDTKFGVKQLMEIGASRRGENYQNLYSNIRTALINSLEHQVKARD